MDLIEKMTKWEKHVNKKPFKPLYAFNHAKSLVPTAEPTDLEGLMHGIAERWLSNPVKKKYGPFASVRVDAVPNPINPFYKKYGLFVSAVVDSIPSETEQIVVPLHVIDNALQANETFKLCAVYGNLTMLDYLGFRNRRKQVIYNGDAGDRFCFQAGTDTNNTQSTHSTAVLTGNAGNEAGAHQRNNSSIIILGNVGNQLNKFQKGGLTYVGGNAGTSVNYCKKKGLTYIEGSVGKLAANKMSGGGLVVKGSVGANWASGLRNDAEVCICGKAAHYEADRPGGTIHVGTQMPPWAQDLSKKFADEVRSLSKQGFNRYFS